MFLGKFTNYYANFRPMLQKVFIIDYHRHIDFDSKKCLYIKHHFVI